jgi:hypothetical protein
MGEYHGIIVNLSQKDRSIFRELSVIGRKKMFLGWLVLYKIRVAPEDFDALIQRIQAKMAESVFFLRKEFYCHFYRGDELVIVFRRKVFHVKTVPESWRDAIAYGRSIGIAASQLDFSPCRFQDETY